MRALLKTVIATILQWEARLVLRKYRPRIVAVTGSVGKTTTKDALYTAMSDARFVRKSEKSYNSEIGIPLTILGITNAWYNPALWLKNIWEGVVLIATKNHYPRWLVLEVGADRPGDIQKVARWLRSDIVVITRLPELPVHVEFFDSVQELIEEKWALAESLKEGGTLVLNFDDERVRALKRRAQNLVLTYGFEDGADVIASNERIFYDAGGAPAGVQFRVDYAGSSVPVTLRGVLGRQHAYAALAALTAGIAQDLNMVTMGGALSHYSPAPGRMRVVEGKRGATLIDDSYNASPAALEEALNTLEAVETKGRKIAVLGDMLELGSHAAAAHRAAGVQCAKTAYMIVTVGVRARHIAQEARAKRFAKTRIIECTTSEEAADYLKERIKENDVVLIKGSQSMRMERITRALMAHPERAAELLPRQEAEWQQR